MSVRRRGTKIPSQVRKLFETGSVRAGVLAGATYPPDILTNAKTGEQVPDARAGMPVAAIAMALEYGHGQNHPRPFMQLSVANHGSQWSAIVRESLKAGVSAHETLLTTGLVMSEDIQQTIRDWPADNKEKWAEFKGFNHGLILAGHLVNSIASASDDV